VTSKDSATAPYAVNLMRVHDVRIATELSAGAGVPLHRQLFLVLHDEIARGALSPGDPLPTEQSLCEQFGVSRITVRRALTDLSDAGLIQRKQGVGSFVRDNAPMRRQTGGRSFIDELRKIEFETEAEVLERDIRSVPRVVADQLGCARALHVHRLRRARRTGEPLMITEAWLPIGLADVITEDELSRVPLYRLLSNAGVQLERVQNEITAEIAGPTAARLLDTAIGAALMRINRVAFVGGEPHHYLSTLLSPNRSRIVFSQAAVGDADDGLSVAHDVSRPSD